MTTYFDNDRSDSVLPNAALTRGDDRSKLFLFASPEHATSLARFDLGPYRLFRPDYDSQFTSESGRVWRPVE